LRNSLLPRRLHNHLEKMHHLSIVYPLRYLLQQQRMLNVVKGLYDTLPVISTSLTRSPLFVLAIRSKANRSTFSLRCIGKVDYFSF